MASEMTFNTRWLHKVIIIAIITRAWTIHLIRPKCVYQITSLASTLLGTCQTRIKTRQAIRSCTVVIICPIARAGIIKDRWSLTCNWGFTWNTIIRSDFATFTCRITDETCRNFIVSITLWAVTSFCDWVNVTEGIQRAGDTFNCSTSTWAAGVITCSTHTYNTIIIKTHIT